MGFRRKNIEIPRVELTPMIDVVFLLLIFFMISTTFIENPGLQIDLPESSAQQLPADADEVQIYLAETGDIYYQRELVSLAALRAQLLSHGTAAAKMTFLLMADKAARHGRVVELMDLAKSAGFGKLAIATDKPTNQTAEEKRGQ